MIATISPKLQARREMIEARTERQIMLRGFIAQELNSARKHGIRARRSALTRSVEGFFTGGSLSRANNWALSSGDPESLRQTRYCYDFIFNNYINLLYW